MKVRQCLSNYVELFEPRSANVSSLEELLELPWIKSLARTDHKFHRFSRNRIDDRWFLMAERQDGAWCVAGFVSGEDAEHIMSPLPVWTYSLRVS